MAVLNEVKRLRYRCSGVSQAAIFIYLLSKWPKEFSRFKELESGTVLKIFFADAYAAWQRETNENTNGLLRFYFPKGTDFRRISDAKLAKVVEKLNHRPRKCLGYRTPHEVFCEARDGALAS